MFRTVIQYEIFVFILTTAPAPLRILLYYYQVIRTGSHDDFRNDLHMSMKAGRNSFHTV